jgi:CBS domain containing-hemolysin-like protein
LLAAALSSFYGGAIAGLSALGRLLEERERDPEPPGLTAFILRDATAAVTSWLLGGLFLGLGAALCLGQTLRAVLPDLAPSAALVLAQLLCTGVLLLGLLAWKHLAEAQPRRYCVVAAALVLPVYIVLYPLRRPLGAALVRLYPPLSLRAGVMFAADVKEIAENDDNPRLLDRDEREMIARVFELGETVVREIMVPRIDMVAVEESTPIPDVIRVIQEQGHSRLPVYHDQVDNIVGFLYIKDLITNHDRLDVVQLRDLVRPAYFVPETKRVDELLAEMRSRRLYLAIVVDEYGGTAGLVTMEDVIEEVVGEIHDELDEPQPLLSSVGDGSFRVDAKVNLDDFNARLGVRLPADEYDTLGGFLYALAGKIPAAGDRFEHEGLEFTIGSVRGKRITQVQVRPLRSQLADGSPGAE